jgi:hypothetical protein
VYPADVGNRVMVLFRVNQRTVETVPANWMRTDPSRNTQYFRAVLSTFQEGDTIQYGAVCQRGNRSVPATGDPQVLASSFRVQAAQEVQVPMRELSTSAGSAQAISSITSPTDAQRSPNAFFATAQIVGSASLPTPQVRQPSLTVTDSLPAIDDPSYRDYLLSIFDWFVSAFRSPKGEFETDDDFRQRTRQATLQSLRQMFKQDFATMDNNSIGSNRVPIEVMTLALVEDFGTTASSIPSQGANEADRDYLDTLITLSGQTSEALTTKYRISFSRSDLDRTTHVHQAILTLQSHFRDGDVIEGRNPFFLYKDEWQQRFRTPFFPENHYELKTGLFSSPTVRVAAEGLVTAVKARPEFQDDGLLQRFVTRLEMLLGIPGVDIGVDGHLVEGHRQFVAEEYAAARAHYAQAGDSVRRVVKEMRIFLTGADGLSGALTPLLDDALVPLGKEGADLFRASLDPNFQLSPLPPAVTQHGNSYDIPNGVVPSDGDFPFTNFLLAQLAARYDDRKAARVDSANSLAALQLRNVVDWSLVNPRSILASYDDLADAIKRLHDGLISLVPHVMFLLLPICHGDIAAASGDVIAAANWYSQVGREHLLRASLTSDFPGSLPADGDLPWGWSLSHDFWATHGRDYPYLNNACEGPMLKLRLGTLYLAWADRLYRSGRETEVFRARELYKALLRQHGMPPQLGSAFASFPGGTALITTMPGRLADVSPEGSPEASSGRPGPDENIEIGLDISQGTEELTTTSPAWSPVIASQLSPSLLGRPVFALSSGTFNTDGVSGPPMPVNPAIVVQELRAQSALTQIDNGLNFFGYSQDLVPILRYRTLALTAQHFARLAKQAEADYLSFKDRAENAELGVMQAQNAVAVARLRVEIESQRILEAGDFVAQSTIQVQQVRDAIDEKEKEIADHDSLCGQVKDFFGGLLDFFKGGVPDFAADYMKSDFKVAFALESHEAGAAAGLGVVGGFALFGIASGVTVSGMADKANARVTDLTRLQNQQLPMALAALDARNRELVVAQLQKGVATLEASLANEVLRYSMLRTLNMDAWAHMASAMRRILHRYLDLGALTGWLAERALSYHQDRDIRLIRFDYLSHEEAGSLAADTLQADLAALEAEYVVGFREMVPIKWTISLARDFPLEFGQLKTSGSCSFMTSAASLDLAYPGCFAHRIRSLEVRAVVPATEQIPRGLLRNPGLSTLDDETVGKSHVLVRPPDVYPLSEFSLQGDMAIYGLPDESLMPFEGSGIETFWTLELPPAANPNSLANLADVVITFRLNPRFSTHRRNEVLSATPTISRSLLLSAQQSYPEQLQTFANEQATTITFAVTSDLLPFAESNRQVRNVAIFFIGDNVPVITCTLASTMQPQGVSFTTSQGLAHSNRVPEPAGSAMQLPPSNLDAIASGGVDQDWLLTVPRDDNPNLDTNTIRDVILGLEYTAQPVLEKSLP